MNRRMGPHEDFEIPRRCVDDLLVMGETKTRKTIEGQLADYLDRLSEKLKGFRMYHPQFDTAGLRDGNYNLTKLASQLSALRILDVEYGLNSLFN